MDGGGADSRLTPIGDAPLGLRTLLDVCAPGGQVVLTDGARARIAAARRVVDGYAAGPELVYGLNTGLGGNLGHRLDPADLAAFQTQLIRGRTIGVGPSFQPMVCRAALLCRIAGLAAGGSGISAGPLDLLVAMFNAGVTPVIPGRGSIGAGDLGLGGHIGAVVIGRGAAAIGDTVLPGAEALAAAGLRPATLAPKDGLALLNSSAVTCGHAAVVLAALSDTLLLSFAAASLSCEGYGANFATFDPRVAAARPASGQVLAAAVFRRLLRGSPLEQPGAARAIQDALSFRVLPQISGPVIEAFRTATDAVATELNAASDNPLVLAQDGRMMSTANFHTPAIALAFDTLAIGLCHLATASAYRITKLMNPALSGLPRYLSPVGGASAGLNPLQKTAAYLHAEIRLRATPASLDALPVSDSVEDHAPHTPLTIRKLEEQLLPWRLLVAVEATTAAQAADLRGAGMGELTGMVQAVVRSAVPMLDEDRETGPDTDRVAAALFAGDLCRALKAGLAGLGLPVLMG